MPTETGPQPDRDGRVVNDDPTRPLHPGHPLRSQDVEALIPRHVDGAIAEPRRR